MRKIRSQAVKSSGFFGEKEIVFCANGKTKSLKLSSIAQVFLLVAFVYAFFWVFYATHIYNESANIINAKDKQLNDAQNAYSFLVSDLQTLKDKIISVNKTISKNRKYKKDAKKLDFMANEIDKKVASYNEKKSFLTSDDLEERIAIRKAILLRDIANSERDELEIQMKSTLEAVEDMKIAELDVLNRVDKLASKEVNKIKKLVQKINIPVKKKGLYFNAMATKKKLIGKGGPYIPAKKYEIKDKKLKDKLTQVHKKIDEWKIYRELVKFIPLGKPLKRYWVSAPYGGRNDPFNNQKAFHAGVDMASKKGSAITTRARGIVKRAYYNGGYGKFVEIDHGNGFMTRYAHLNEILVKKGDYLDVGDKIGKVGSTGRSTGPHLHYEVLYKRRAVDPNNFIKAKI
jgi:murein DD-endopeptidase MepM/ murein hydrolase activator NlpD